MLSTTAARLLCVLPSPLSVLFSSSWPGRARLNCSWRCLRPRPTRRALLWGRVPSQRGFFLLALDFVGAIRIVCKPHTYNVCGLHTLRFALTKTSKQGKQTHTGSGPAPTAEPGVCVGL